jgi:predicted alpha/beta superfamily hydrolase
MIKSVSLAVLLFLGVFAAAAQNVKPLSIGEVHTIKSDFLNEERFLNIYLPEKFDKEKNYPIIYLLDGSIHEDFLHIVGLVQYFNLQFTMPESIVIGIANVDRKRDFTFPTAIEELKKDYPTTGHSGKFIQFLEQELKPYIDEYFKNDGNEYIIGQSLGGLLATEILLSKPNLFSHYFIVSPSLWWDDQSVLKGASSKFANFTTKPKHVYISVGKKEHPVMVRDAENFFETLDSVKGSTTIKFNLMKEEDHGTILHNSIYNGFEYLFPAKKY